jgi:hypothetical protein
MVRPMISCASSRKARPHTWPSLSVIEIGDRLLGRRREIVEAVHDLSAQREPGARTINDQIRPGPRGCSRGRTPKTTYKPRLTNAGQSSGLPLPKISEKNGGTSQAPPSLGRKRPRKQTARQCRVVAMHNLGFVLSGRNAPVPDIQMHGLNCRTCALPATHCPRRQADLLLKMPLHDAEK